MNIKWIIVNQFGLNPKKFVRALFGLPRFYRDFKKFKSQYGNKNLILSPCLSDWYENAGDNESEYFIQDLFISQLVFKNNPKKHVDIGSRIDGFVGNIASFREIEIFDIRKINKETNNIKFKQRDLMLEDENYSNYTDSLSCLHSLEHFGLGRYGDPINPDGYIKALKNLSDMLVKNGTFYLSVPLGKERVEFNSLRVFYLDTIISISSYYSLKLSSFYTLSNGNILKYELDNISDTIKCINSVDYILGIFIFNKV